MIMEDNSLIQVLFFRGKYMNNEYTDKDYC